MRRRLIGTMSVCLLLAVTACTAKTGTGATAPKATASSKATTPATTGAATAQTTIQGRLMVPASAGIIAGGGGNIIAGGGGNLSNPVAGGGASFVGDRRLLAVEEAPVAGATVYLADAAGEPIPGLDEVKTDANGQFTIPDVPADFTFVVAAEAKDEDGKTETFQTLVNSGKLGATANVSAASTLVTASVVDGLGADLGEFNPAAFRTATETTAKNLTTENMPDFADRADVIATMNTMITAIAELKTALDAVKQDLKDIKSSLADLTATIKAQAEAQAQTGTTGTTDTQVASGTPQPTATRAPDGSQPPPPPPSGDPRTGGTPMPGGTPQPGGTAMPPPPGSPPPGSPPPGGCQPGPMPAQPPQPMPHFLHIDIASGASLSGLQLHFMPPNQGSDIMGFPVTLTGPDVTVRVPEGLVHNVKLTDASGRQVGGAISCFVIRVGTTDSATAPFPLHFLAN